MSAARERLSKRFNLFIACLLLLASVQTMLALAAGAVPWWLAPLPWVVALGMAVYAPFALPGAFATTHAGELEVAASEAAEPLLARSRRQSRIEPLAGGVWVEPDGPPPGDARSRLKEVARTKP